MELVLLHHNRRSNFENVDCYVFAASFSALYCRLRNLEDKVSGSPVCDLLVKYGSDTGDMILAQCLLFTAQKNKLWLHVKNDSIKIKSSHSWLQPSGYSKILPISIASLPQSTPVSPPVMVKLNIYCCYGYSQGSRDSLSPFQNSLPLSQKSCIRCLDSVS